ncbi:MAG: rhodanese [Thiobacillus sp. SCN 63-1177]|nr:MAG: rhodanese [Thiobacillus sp. SCN 63-1177]
MTVDRIVHLVAGLVVLISIALAHFVNPAWLWLTVIVGANLAQSGVTGFCPLAFMLKKSGVREGSCCS